MYKPLQLKNLMLGAMAAIMLISAVPVDQKKENNIEPPPSASASMTVGDLLNMKSKDLSAIIGHKPSMKEKIVFRIGQLQLLRELRRNGLTRDARINADQWMAEGEKKFDFAGFALGFLLGALGVALAYVIKKDDKVFTKSAWIGFGVVAVIIVALYAVLIAILYQEG